MTPSTAGAHAPTESDPRGPSPRVLLGIERNRTTSPEVHPHRAVSVTRSYRETEGAAARPPPRRGCSAASWTTHPIVIQDGEVIVGMKTRKPRGSPVFPEINCAWVERDLDRLATRKDTPFFVERRDQARPARGGLPVLARPAGRRPPRCGGAARACGAPTSAASSTTTSARARSGTSTPATTKVLARGMDGIRADVERVAWRARRRRPGDAAERQFLESVVLACDGGRSASPRRHAAEARRLAGAGARPPSGGPSCSEMADVCERVPAAPAAHLPARRCSRSGSRTSC